MIKCGVCGSENEAEAQFCGVCGSPLSPAEAKAVADDATKATETTPAGDDSVVPGKGGARRDLGTGGGTDTAPKGKSTATEAAEAVVDQETASGGPTIVCSVCGTVNDATRTYCRKCATELRQAAPPPPPPPTATGGRKFSPLALGLGAAAVVVAIALIAVLVFGGGPVASTAPSAVASPGASPAGSVTPGETTAPTPTQRTFSEGDLSGQIAFARCAEGGTDCVIYLRPADKSEAARRIIGVDGGSATDPALSHDGERIFYSADGDDPGLRIVTIATRSFTQHSTGDGDTNVDWSSDDSQITFAGHRDRDPDPNGDLEIRLDGITVGGSSEPQTTNDVLDHDPVFGPGDTTIVFVQGEDDQAELKELDIDTVAIKDLTSDEFADADPAVSPDGTEVVFASTRGGDDEFDLFLLNLATQEITALPTMAGDERDPVWSPGGRYIAFSGGSEGVEDIFILDLADNSFTQFTTAAGAEQTPSWK